MIEQHITLFFIFVGSLIVLLIAGVFLTLGLLQFSAWLERRRML